MKRFIIAFYATSVLIACNDAKTETKTEEPTLVTTAAEVKPNEWVPVDSATAMKTMTEAGTPGQQHAMLAKGDGKWTAETTMWMAPDAPPMVAKSNAVNKMVLGGRYQQTSFKGDFMGMAFEGYSTTGYDNVKKVFFTSWADNMSTGLMNMEGTWDEPSQSINFKGKMICPGNGQECEMREVYKIVDDNTHIMEMYGPDMKTGKEYKNMEVKFIRSK